MDLLQSLHDNVYINELLFLQLVELLQSYNTHLKYEQLLHFQA